MERTVSKIVIIKSVIDAVNIQIVFMDNKTGKVCIRWWTGKFLFPYISSGLENLPLQGIQQNI